MLARQVDGCRLDDVELVGAVLPVSWRRGPDQAISLAREIEAACREVDVGRVHAHTSALPDVAEATFAALEGYVAQRRA